MLEVLLIIFLCNKNKANAMSRGRKPGGFVALTITLWVGMELLGGLIGAAADMGYGAYGLAILFAAIGGLTSYLIAKNCKRGDYVSPAQSIAESIAHSAEALASPTQIVLVRDSSMVGALVRWDFMLNGQMIGSLSNGSSLTATTSLRQNVLQARDAYGSELPPYVFDVAEGSTAEIHFKANKFLTAQSRGVIPHTAYAAKPPVAPTQAQAAFCIKCGHRLADGAAFCANCGERRFSLTPTEPHPAAYSTDGWAQSAPDGSVQTEAEILAPKPDRALWAAGLLLLSWVLLFLIQGLFRGGLTYNSEAGFFISMALLGTAVFLICQQSIAHKCIGGAMGLLTTVLSAGNIYALQLQYKAMRFTLLDVLNFSSPVFWRGFLPTLFCSVLTLGAAALTDYLFKQRTERRRVIASSGIAAGVFFAFSLIRTLVQQGRVLGRMDLLNIISIFIGLLADPMVLFLTALFLIKLCSMPRKELHLRGLGLAWAWIAVVGMFASLMILFVSGTAGAENVNYTSGLLLAICGLAGYILMLCKRRIGFYLLVAGVALMLGSQFFAALTAILYRSHQHTALFVGSILGAVNPLLAWLTVRSADRQPYFAPISYAQPVVQSISGFHKFTTIFLIVVGGIFLLLPFPFLLSGERFVGGMAICMMIGLLVAGFGVWCAVAQRSKVKLYPTWMKVATIVLFSICAVILLITIIGVLFSL